MLTPRADPARGPGKRSVWGRPDAGWGVCRADTRPLGLLLPAWPGLCAFASPRHGLRASCASEGHHGSDWHCPPGFPLGDQTRVLGKSPNPTSSAASPRPSPPARGSCQPAVQPLGCVAPGHLIKSRRDSALAVAWGQAGRGQASPRETLVSLRSLRGLQTDVLSPFRRRLFCRPGVLGESGTQGLRVFLPVRPLSRLRPPFSAARGSRSPVPGRPWLCAFASPRAARRPWGCHP